MATSCGSAPNTGSASTRDSLLGYPLNNNRQYSGWSSPPGVESVEVPEASISQTEATATVTVSQADGGLVNLRYRETASSGNWETTSLAVEVGVPTVEFPLSGLTADREYTVEASFDSSFPTTRTKTASFNDAATGDRVGRRDRDGPDHGHHQGHHQRAQQRLEGSPSSLSDQGRDGLAGNGPGRYDR